MVAARHKITHVGVPVQVVRGTTGAVAEQNIFTFPTAEAHGRVGHAALSFVILTLDYALMLATMTFNVGIFFAVIFGLTLGMFLFRHIGSRATERMQVLLLLPTAYTCVSVCKSSVEVPHVDKLGPWVLQGSLQPTARSSSIKHGRAPVCRLALCSLQLTQLFQVFQRMKPPDLKKLRPKCLTV
jgi:hypothetical protein